MRCGADSTSRFGLYCRVPMGSPDNANGLWSDGADARN